MCGRVWGYDQGMTGLVKRITDLSNDFASRQQLS